MIRNKFKGQYVGGMLQADWNFDDLKMTMRELGSFELVARKPIEWNVDQMRKFVHGPVTKFMIQQHKNRGEVYTIPQMHQKLRDDFLPYEEVKTSTNRIIVRPVSSESIGRDGYKQWLTDINDFCMAELNCELPTADEIE